MSVCQIDFLLHYDNNQTVYKGWTWLLALKSEAIVKVEIDWTEKSGRRVWFIESKRQKQNDSSRLLHIIVLYIFSNRKHGYKRSLSYREVCRKMSLGFI